MRSFGKSAQDERLERLRHSPLWNGEQLRNSTRYCPGVGCLVLLGRH